MIGFYFSGSSHAASDDRLRKVVRHRLVTVYEAFRRVQFAWVQRAAQLPEWKEREVMVDSGAFSAFTSGKPITLEEVSWAYDTYMALAPRFRAIHLINLDVIPGEAGLKLRRKRPTGDQIARALEESDRNFAVLRRRFGPVILPVFHRLESWERLEELKRMSKYIAISPGQYIAEQARIDWAKLVLHQCQGWRVHGLAATGERLMLEVPWASVDSASWVISASLGTIFTAAGGKFRSVVVSSTSPRRNEFSKHYDTLTPAGQRAVREEAAGHGFDIKILRTDYAERSLYNAIVTETFLRGARHNHGTGVQTTLFGS